MSLIKKPSELKVNTLVKTLVYGQPGIGKTTLALSTPSPLLFDFDGGVHRVNAKHQVDTVQIESWQNMLDVLANEDLSAYKTFVIDTAGKMLDYMGAWLIANNPKLGKSNGALSLQGYGERKAEFRAFLKRVALMGKHIVFVAHDTEEKDGDQKIIRPEIGGSSGSDLIKELDLVGYMEAIGAKRTISFDPCEKYYGKNTCQLPSKVEIVDVVNGSHANIFLTKVFSDYQNSLEERKKVAIEYNELIDLIEEKVDSINDAESANEVAAWAGSYTEHIWDSKLQSGMKINVKAKELGLTLNKNKKYEKPKAAKHEAAEV